MAVNVIQRFGTIEALAAELQADARELSQAYIVGGSISDLAQSLSAMRRKLSACLGLCKELRGESLRELGTAAAAAMRDVDD